MNPVVFLAALLISVPVAIVLIVTSIWYIWESGNTILYDSFVQKMFVSLESYGSNRRHVARDGPRDGGRGLRPRFRRRHDRRRGLAGTRHPTLNDVCDLWRASAGPHQRHDHRGHHADPLFRAGRHNYRLGSLVSQRRTDDPVRGRVGAVAGVNSLTIPVAIIGGIVLGIATPTESAAIAFVVGWLVYGQLKPTQLGEMFKRTAMNASMIIFMIAAASVFGWVIIYEELPQRLAGLITSITSDPFMFFLIANVALLLIGMVIDGIAAIVLITPILLPIAIGHYDISPYQFGVVICLNLVLGLLTPPVGIGLYIASSMSETSPGAILKALWPWRLCWFCSVIFLFHERTQSSR